ncbi:DUF2189 domain-containing protein [Hyphomonas johnsonii]|jgi:uncharacterized membrane protein|uniref:Putative cytochrome c oxidase subunit I n=1 Tax=Hyphomonas johnsonii MHS-2 TaxID=1280950 RepID=A0A059FRY0_9PROT|nr:DUF2189 domain-containing protein [Hyphomonas johnsonii]KCZ93425.1 putative cytochrome c oxidase subunit I [Hyphomonas johnsonii MHS-2]
MTNQDIPAHLPPLRHDYARHLGLFEPFHWLGKGVQDTFRKPLSSLFFGLMVFCVSILIVGGLIRFGVDYILLPALSGFMVVGPAIAVGLYEKSRRLEAGEPISLFRMIFVKSKSPGQILFIGVILMLLMVLWLRAAFLLYALFFGMVPFSGFDHLVGSVLMTPRGWALLAVGSAVGGLFASFAFAISAFSIPMLLNEKKDAFTAMGTSMVVAWNNKEVAVVWGAIIVALFAFCLVTALTGLILVYPILGHGTWHAYRALADET